MKKVTLKVSRLICMLSVVLFCITFFSSSAFATESNDPVTSGIVNKGDTEYEYAWSYDAATGTLNITMTGSRIWNAQPKQIINDNTFSENVAKFGGNVKTLVFNKCYKINGRISVFNDLCPNIEKIVLEVSGGYRFVHSDQFSGMKSLKVVTTTKNPDINYLDFSDLIVIADYESSFLGFFNGCSSVRKIVLPSENGFPTNPNGPTTFIPSNTFADCTSLTDIVLPDWVTEIKSGAFKNCTSLKSINIPASVTSIASDAFTGAGVEKVVFDGTDISVITAAFDKNVVIYTENADVKKKLTSAGYTAKSSLDDVTAGGTVVNGTQTYVWSFDGSSKALTLNVTEGKAWGEELTYRVSKDADFIEFAKKYSEYVKTIKVGGFRKLRGAFSLLGCANVETIVFENCENRFDSAYSANMFANLPKLKTLKLNGSAESVDYIDLTKIGSIGNSNGENTENMFMNCVSIEKVVLPSTAFVGTSGNMPYILKGMLDGCTSLFDINFPAWITEVKENAFRNCTSLKEISVECESAPTLAAGSFTGCSGITFYCKSTEVADAINAQLDAAGCTNSVAISLAKGSMTADGFSVRCTGYNGLRMHFVFNETFNNGNGYNLVEYGTICATAENYAKYTETFGKTDSLIGSDFTSPAKIAKVVVWNKDTGYNSKVDGSNHEKVEFTVTITNFTEGQYNSEVKSVGYEIWERDGSYYVIYTSYPNTDYSTVSLLKVTLGMLTAYPEYLTVGDNPIWNVLSASEHTDIETDNQNVTAMLFDDPITAGKKIAVYASEGTESIEIASLGLTKEEKNLVSAYIYGKNVSSALPELNNVWREYMEAKMEEVPEGKSFIFITDTHTGHDKYSSTLVNYARKALGIDNVIFGGDSFDAGDGTEKGFSAGSADDAEASRRLAREALDDFAGAQFFNVYGKSGIYVQGNHDANYVKWQRLSKAENVSEKNLEKYLLSDTEIFDLTIKRALDLGKELVFDEAGIEKIKTLDFEANSMYTAEEMKNEAIAAMKKHYYYNDTKNGIRYIVLDTGDNGITHQLSLNGQNITTDTETIYGLSYTKFLYYQMNWLIDTLGSVPTDYDVVVAGHMLAEGFDSQNQWYLSDSTVAVQQILKAYKNKESGTAGVWVGKQLYNAAKFLGITVTETDGNMAYFSYDFTSANPSTVFSVSGHCHCDRAFIAAPNRTTEGKILHEYGSASAPAGGVLMILTSTDAIGYQTFKNEPPMESNTTSANCFDIVTITTDGRVVCTRIGAGENRAFIYN